MVSVTGISILVTLMMTFCLNKAGGEKSATVEPRAKDNIKSHIQSLSQMPCL
jgi:hypothetical protein